MSTNNNLQLELSDGPGSGSGSKELKKIISLIEDISGVGNPPSSSDDNNGVSNEENDDKIELKKHILNSLNDFVGKKLQKGLEKKYGDCGFVVTLKPIKNYKYTLSHISWNDGPTPHNLFYFIKDKYSYYLSSSSNDKFDESLFTRTISNIEKRYTSFFFPIPIRNKKIKSMPIMINKVLLSDKNTYYYSVDVLDDKLNLKDIRGSTLKAALSSLQVRIEGVYYQDDSLELSSDDNVKPHDAHKHLLKKYITEDEEEEEDEELNTEPDTKK